MQRLQDKQKKEREELLARLTAPTHISESRFSEHEKIEGYQEDRSVPQFFGCDRLLKSENQFGSIQMGYDPKRQQAVLFARIKTSIYDNAASREHREMTDRQRMGEQKTATSNRSYVAKRRQNSAVILYKAENKPWSERSIAPYLKRVNTGALRKTLPFLGAGLERQERETLLQKQKLLLQNERASFLARNDNGVRAVRKEQRELKRVDEQLSSIIWRKERQSGLFFRRINLVFDLQKADMFAYYRSKAITHRVEAENVNPEKPQDENEA